MPDVPGLDLVREWRAAMESIAASAGRSDLARLLVAPVQRQAELLQQMFERERRLQNELLGHVFEPLDGAFDLLEASASSLRAQAEALGHAAAAMEQAAGLMRTQGELLERAVGILREPPRRVEAALGVEPRRRERPAAP